MGWHGVANPTSEQQDANFLPPLGNFFVITYCFFIIVAKERSPDYFIDGWMDGWMD